MKKLTVLFFIPAFVLLVIISAQAQPDKGTPQKPHDMAMIKNLNLDKDQKEKITRKQKEINAEVLPLKQSIKALRLDINKELSMENPDEVKIDQLIENISNNMTEIQKKRMSFVLWMRSQLSPEQKQKLNSIMQNIEKSAPKSSGPENNND